MHLLILHPRYAEEHATKAPLSGSAQRRRKTTAHLIGHIFQFRNNLLMKRRNKHERNGDKKLLRKREKQKSSRCSRTGQRRGSARESLRANVRAYKHTSRRREPKHDGGKPTTRPTSAVLWMSSAFPGQAFSSSMWDMISACLAPLCR